MPVIYLLRHGQASFGTDDYDVLSDLGVRQAELAGHELGRRGVRAPAFWSGGLLRQRSTAQIAAAAMGRPGDPLIDPRFDEFDAHGAVNAHLGRPDATVGMSSDEFQRHLDDVMMAWFAAGDERWAGFVDGAYDALVAVAAGLAPGSDAIVATSAGVTAALVGRLLGADAAGVVALNRVSVNASITTVVAGARGLSLVSFNDHAHLLGQPGLRTNR
ncbi:MAG: histidine phosphatase family protein [Actinomycetales bacterium]|nr:histidine phosphatase family protein [Actinomycetales bacterium]